MALDNTPQTTRAARAGEMSYHQRGIIESCFEESNYEQAISTLRQFQDPTVWPNPAHIRQLIYIALHPPPTDALSESKKGKAKATSGYSLNAVSPSKIRQRTKNGFVPPSKEATERAWGLLHEYQLAYPPEVLLRAVPCYPLRDLEASRIPRTPDIQIPWKHTLGEEDLDSGVAKVAVTLKEHKDCWSLLRPGIVGSDGSSNARNPFATMRPDDEDEEEDEIAQSIIGEYSWRLLEWFVGLFEKDHELVDSNRSDRFSFCLLIQIKPPGSINEPRSNVETIVEIIFTCYTLTDEQRQRLGKRLMALLIDLTSSPDFMPTQLITMITSRLSDLSESDGLKRRFLVDLPTSARGHAFKLAVCDRYFVAQDSLHGYTGAHPRGAARPQARKARPLQATTDSGGLTQGKIVGSTPKSTSTRTNRYPWTLPDTARIIDLLDAVSKTPKIRFIDLFILYQTLLAFSSLEIDVQKKTGEVNDLWRNALQGDHLIKRISDAFSAGHLTESQKFICTEWKDIILDALDDSREIIASK